MLEKLRDLVQHAHLQPDAIMRIARDNDDAIIHTAYSEAFIVRSECKGLFAGQPGSKNIILGISDLGLLKYVLSRADSVEFCETTHGAPFLEVVSEHSKYQHSVMHSLLIERLTFIKSPPELTPDLVLGNPKDAAIAGFLKDIAAYQTHIKELPGVVLSTVNDDLIFELDSEHVCRGVLKPGFGTIGSARLAVSDILSSIKAIPQTDTVVMHVLRKGFIVIEAVSSLAKHLYCIGGLSV